MDETIEVGDLVGAHDIIAMLASGYTLGPHRCGIVISIINGTKYCMVEWLDSDDVLNNPIGQTITGTLRVIHKGESSD